MSLWLIEYNIISEYEISNYDLCYRPRTITTDYVRVRVV